MPAEGAVIPERPGVLAEEAIYALVEARAEASPEAPLAFDERGRSLAFGEYRERVLATAAGLLEAGVEPGGRVAWQLTTSLEALVLAGALSRLGVTQVLLLPAYRNSELEHIVGQADPQALVVSERAQGCDYVGLAREVQARFERLRVLTVEEIGAGAGAGAALPEYSPPAPEEARWLIYTSGTTGPPKGVRHSDASVVAGSRAQWQAIELGPEDRQTINYPFAHIGGVMTLASLLATGGSAVLVERFRPAEHVPLFRRLGVTIPGAGPPFFRMYLAEQRKQPGESILPGARVFAGGGAPKTPTLHDEVKEEIGGAGIFTGYGMSECPLIATVRLDSPDEKKALTDGLPAAGASIRLVGEDGEEVATGADGEIRVKGPQVFLGYVDPELDREAFDEQGYFRTGDIGRFDAEGYLRLTGRVKDLIIRKGENISPKEIEDLLDRHPKVAEVAVVGLPDEERGELACAAVVAADPAAPLGFEEMTAHLQAAGLARHKLPERLEIVAELPKNAMSKVQKNKLRALLRGSA